MKKVMLVEDEELIIQGILIFSEMFTLGRGFRLNYF